MLSLGHEAQENASCVLSADYYLQYLDSSFKAHFNVGTLENFKKKKGTLKLSWKKKKAMGSVKFGHTTPEVNLLSIFNNNMQACHPCDCTYIQPSCSVT